jgi:hypothetical protein
MAVGDDHSEWIAARDARLRAAGALDGNREPQTTAGTTDWGLRLALWLKPAADAITSLPEKAASAAQSTKEVLFDTPQQLIKIVQLAAILPVAVPAVIWIWKRMRK